MILSKNFLVRSNIWRRLFINNAAVDLVPSQSKFSGLAVCNHNKYVINHGSVTRNQSINYLLPLHRKWCSKGLCEIDNSNLMVKHKNGQKKITELFPMPRVTLNELLSRTPINIFEIQYKQSSVAPKGRKKVSQNEWTCTYTFVWPDKVRFEGTAISKRQAAEKAATQAIHWLYINDRIDLKGQPIYDPKVLDEIKESMNHSIEANISEKSMDRIERIWKDYDVHIKNIYEATFNEAKSKAVETPVVLYKDSTIDQDEYLEEEDELISLFDHSELKQHVHPIYGRNVQPPSKSDIDKRNNVLARRFKHYDDVIIPLPVDKFREKIILALEQFRVAVVVGAAGCGKSTRAPAMILRHWGANTAAIVSEPRRVAAIGLAERVATELDEQIGESIGFQVRLHSKLPKPPGGSILYCTSGVLLRRLQNNPGLEGCTHVIIDEAHERDVNTDVTLLMLKRALLINPDLRILVMSATLDTAVFTKFFDPCPLIEIPGRTYPVEISYLDDLQEIYQVDLTDTLEHCKKDAPKPLVKCQEIAEFIIELDKKAQEGAILVFLPGWAEIKQTKQYLDARFKDSAIHMVLPVHSRLSTADQAKMFQTPSRGIRKIVLATNVAETSITIPDVVHVIDTGAQKENRIKDGIASLETVWVSQASANQRTGRAGRVQSGFCYKMYTKEKEAEFIPHTPPEILRIPLVQTVLECKSYAPKEKAAKFMSQLPEPPSDTAIEFAVNDLKEIGALTQDEQLTRRGSLLSSMTLHPRIALSLLHSVVVGNVVAVSNMAAHCTSNTEIFANAAERREEIREIKRNYSTTSDYGALYWIQDAFERKEQEGGRSATEKFCEKYGLRSDRLGFVRSITNLHLEQLLNSSMLAPVTEAEELNRFSDIEELTSGVLISGADALLTTKKRVKTKGKMKTVIDVVTSTGDRAHVGSESVNKNISKCYNKPALLCYFGGHHSTERRALVVYKTSVVPPHAPLLFCNGEVLKEHVDGETTMLSIPKHNLQIRVPTSQAEHILKIREMLWKTFDYFIERDVASLDFDSNEKVSRFKVNLVKTVGRILVEGHREYVEGKSRVEEIEEFG